MPLEVFCKLKISVQMSVTIIMVGTVSKFIDLKKILNNELQNDHRKWESSDFVMAVPWARPLFSSAI